MRARTRAIAIAGAIALATGQAVPLAAQEVIDRLLAVVDGRIITLSDTRGVLGLSLVPSPAPGADPTAITVKRLIDRELMLREVQRYLPREPAREEIEGRLGRVRERFSSPEAFAAAMQQTGFDSARLAEWIRDDLRIEEYLRERFASAGQLSDAEVEGYLAQHQAELLAGNRSVAEALDQARRLLAAERREALVTEWLDGLRRRADIIELYLSTQG
jgi:hypothetical protein